MDRDALLDRIRRMEPELKQAGLRSLYLFGSRARGDHRPDSDVDLLFETDGRQGFSLFDHADLQVRLSDALEVKVDLIRRAGLRPIFRDAVGNDLVAIF